MKIGLGIFFCVATLGGMIYACVSSTRLATVNIDEELITELSAEALQASFANGGHFDLAQADLQEGFIHIVGEFYPVSGVSEEKVLRYSLSVEDGRLQGDLKVESEQSSAVILPEVLQEFNQRLLKAIVDYVSQNRSGLSFVSVHITEEVIRIEIRFLP